jgi:hypothetical protein
MSCRVNVEKYWPAGEMSYFETVQRARYKKAYKTIREALLIIIRGRLIPQLAGSQREEAGILIFSLSPEKVEERKGILKIRISTFSPVREITVGGELQKFPKEGSLCWAEVSIQA